MNKRIIIFLGIILVAVIALIAFSTRGRTTGNKKLHVVASFYPMYFFASKIGGDKADVFSITPASAEPHDYEPTTQDIARIDTADMLVLNGGSLEAWGDKVKQDLQNNHVKIVTAGDTLVTKQLVEESKTMKDPHIWLDPQLAKIEVAHIEKGFESVDPEDATYFKMNATALEAQLDQLDKEYTAGLSSCQKKDFVTSHAAFAYLAERYGLTQIAIAGVSPDEEPSTQKLAEVADLVKQKHISVIFFESLISPKLSETIAHETGAKTMVLDPIEGITESDQQRGRTYLSVMQDNVHNLQIALECSRS